jgi:(p)ppGpp synthase/HD superfamily hydrolase
MIPNTPPTIDTTLALIQQYHADQTDWAGLPYWQHPLAVMKLLPAGSSLHRRLIALLHDLLEDTKATVDVLSTLGYHDHVIAGVRLLTRPPDIVYLDYIRAIVASGHYDAIWVKLCDNTHNTDPIRITSLSSDHQIKALRMLPRYEKAKHILLDGIIQHFPTTSNIVVQSIRHEPVMAEWIVTVRYRDEDRIMEFPLSAL